MTTNEAVDRAFALGREAARVGASAVPALNPELVEMMLGNPGVNWLSALAAYSRGYRASPAPGRPPP